MNLWLLFIAAFGMGWVILRLFAAERQVRVNQIHAEHMHRMAEQKRALLRAGRG